MTTFVIKVTGDPDRPELYFCYTGNVVERRCATHFATREKADAIHELCGAYAPRGWTSKVEEVGS
jgi:FPC/CPF motif-containing protein YcgG